MFAKHRPYCQACGIYCNFYTEREAVEQFLTFHESCSLVFPIMLVHERDLDPEWEPTVGRLQEEVRSLRDRLPMRTKAHADYSVFGYTQQIPNRLIVDGYSNLKLEDLCNRESKNYYRVLLQAMKERAQELAPGRA